MITVTSVEAQNRFGELLDRSQREPVAITRRGRTVAYVVSGHDLQQLTTVQQRRDEAIRWYAGYRERLVPSPGARELDDRDIDQLVHELR